MRKPPDKTPALWRGKVFHAPKHILNAAQLHTMFKDCGIKKRHTRCLNCGEFENEKHRLDWQNCREVHVLCNKHHRDGSSECSHMQMLYQHFFTSKFFEEHTGVKRQCWERNFYDKCSKERDYASPRSRHEDDRDRRDRGRGSQRDDRQKSKSHGRGGRDNNESDDDGYDSDLELFKQFKKLTNLKEDKKRSRSASRSRHRSQSAPRKKERFAKACYECKAPGHMVHECTNKKCNNCGKRGHIKKNCPDGIHPQQTQHISRLTCGSKQHNAALCPQKDAGLSAAQLKQKAIAEAAARRKRNVKDDEVTEEVDVQQLQEDLQRTGHANTRLVDTLTELKKQKSRMQEHLQKQREHIQKQRKQLDYLWL